MNGIRSEDRGASTGGVAGTTLGLFCEPEFTWAAAALVRIITSTAIAITRLQPLRPASEKNEAKGDMYRLGDSLEAIPT